MVQITQELSFLTITDFVIKNTAPKQLKGGGVEAQNPNGSFTHPPPTLPPLWLVVLPKCGEHRIVRNVLGPEPNGIEDRVPDFTELLS